MSMVWKEHALLKPPTAEEMAEMEPEKLVELHRLYHAAIENSLRDPYRHGWEFDNWKVADKLLVDARTLLLLGANRSGKTFYGAKAVIKAAINNPESTIFCFSQDAQTSVMVQQAAVWGMLPAELRQRVTNETHYVSYSQQNGFAGYKLTLPNKSQIVFKTYTQFQQNESILEGQKLGSPAPTVVNIGAWCDEYLLGMAMLDRLYLRLATHDAKLLLTFTPIHGETETVRNYRGGARTIEERDAPLMKELHGLEGYKVPYVQQNAQKNTAIIYFHTKDNPWGGYETVAEICRAKNDVSYTLMSAYGVPTSNATTSFPCFGEMVNVVKPEDIPKGLTYYMVLDPAGKKNWFMSWIGVDASDTYWVVAEWPDVTFGDWAKTNGGKWVEGEGARGRGYGYDDYIDIIKNVEKQLGIAEVYERLIDPRLGTNKHQTLMGSSSIMEEMCNLGMRFVPAPGLHINEGLQALQSKMAYNVKKPIDGLNRPHFYISNRCENTILALKEYIGEDEKEIFKDPIDCLRYAAIDGIRYVDIKAGGRGMKTRGGY
jgi:hypothetical protein